MRRLRILLFCFSISCFAQPQHAVVKRNVNLQPAPSIDNAPLGQVASEVHVRLLEPAPQAGFYHVQLAEGQEGWILGQHLQVQPAVDLKQYRDNVNSSLQDLNRVRTNLHPAFGCDTCVVSSFYDAQEVKNNSSVMKAALLERFSAPGLEPMAEYAQRFFPSVSEMEVVEYSGRQTIRGDAVKAFWGAVSRFYDKLTSIPSLQVDKLEVQTVPAGADIEIKMASDSEGRKTRTNSAFSNVTRGLYHYTISLGGYKTMTGPLNLVDEDGTHLICELSRESEAGGPHNCKLQ